MRAIGVTRFGGPEALRELDVPAEPLGPGQVRVRIAAATVNPTDTGLRAGRPGSGTTPVGGVAVPGMDIAGTVTEMGAGAEDLAERGLTVGDRVIGIVLPSRAHGGYREEIVLPARSVVRAPREASDVEAATLPMNGLTARQALDLLAPRPGQVLAVTGAAGAVGGYVIQLAKHAGVTVIADASKTDEDMVRSLGADVVVRRGGDIANWVRELYPDGVDILVDAALLGAAALPAVRDGGGVATLRGYTGDGKRRLRVMPVAVAGYAEEREKLGELRDLVDRGILTLRVAETYPAQRAADAHRRIEAGGTRGRLVLRFD